jgi:hypothetical protein
LTHFFPGDVHSWVLVFFLAGFFGLGSFGTAWCGLGLLVLVCLLVRYFFIQVNGALFWILGFLISVSFYFLFCTDFCFFLFNALLALMMA